MDAKRSPKEVMRHLLTLTPAEREALKPADGFEQVAQTYLSEAIESKDGTMLKYVIELAETDTAKTTVVSDKELRARFMSKIEEGIDE